MKTMTCRQLGGACDLEFTAETFEEMVELSKNHGMEMFQKGDAAHLDAMNKIKQLMQTPEAMATYFDNKRQQFNDLPDN